MTTMHFYNAFSLSYIFFVIIFSHDSYDLVCLHTHTHTVLHWPLWMFYVNAINEYLFLSNVIMKCYIMKLFIKKRLKHGSLHVHATSVYCVCSGDSASGDKTTLKRTRDYILMLCTWEIKDKKIYGEGFLFMSKHLFSSVLAPEMGWFWIKVDCKSHRLYSTFLLIPIFLFPLYSVLMF